MTMPIQFDTAQYIRTLTDAGIPREQAEAHADGLRLALSQPVAADSDLAIQRAEMRAWLEAMELRLEAKMRTELDARLRPIYFWLGTLTVMQVITMTKLFF
ncbi:MULTISPECIES: hypothetical protein [unclassified Duganella]|uniref:hypothetical protein n=1 Tax=unclassified Duganella TaxID=2636909 RepID=UPI0006F32603|nr:MULTISPECIES: hypothetical protein [unclassified Duganella]KQV42990.1 hypothetical protein ASD07_21350 [Duganella sp. Root336D2]